MNIALQVAQTSLFGSFLSIHFFFLPVPLPLQVSMDFVPSAFLEHLIDTLSISMLHALKELCGRCGQLAQRAINYRATHWITVHEGLQKSSYLQYECKERGQREHDKVEDVPKRYIRNVAVALYDSQVENVSREVMRKYRNAYFHFWLGSSSINEAWVDLAYSLKRLGSILLDRKLDDEALRLFQKLVDGRKLSTLIITSGAYEGAIVGICKSLLLQDQFKMIEFRNFGRHLKDGSVRELLETWSANNEQLRGKGFNVALGCESAVKELEQFVRRGTVTPCEKEESKFRDMEHSQVTDFKPLYVYRYEEGEEGDKRKFYISFKCAQNERHTVEGKFSTNRRSVLCQLHCECVCAKYIRVAFA
uniref:F-box domain-containing protein n=1 Tax=Steinernema glaseri TaxID=37863 RepID=A0A1I8AIB5_9BILA